MKIITGNITKSYSIKDSKVNCIEFKNNLTDTTEVFNTPNEIIINYFPEERKPVDSISMQEMTVVNTDNNTLTLKGVKDGLEWNVEIINNIVNDYISVGAKISCSNMNIKIDSLQWLSVDLNAKAFSWSRPYCSERIHIQPYFASLGQPVYYKEFFFGIENMAADNMIDNSMLSMKYYLGRSLAELGKDYVLPTYVVGGGIKDTMIDMQNAFYKYVATFARPNRFRIQFNSWYDNMLDITPENLKKSFTEIATKFKESGLRDLDCYVVDDGWVDYRKSEFWAFNKKFPNEFYEESKLVKSFNSTFGVWFGPIGGYSESLRYARKLKKLGYFVNKSCAQICAADPRYVSDLADKMIEFIHKYNVSYFKIDGFGLNPCPSKKHNHPVGGYKNLCLYTFQWEQWCKAFEKIRNDTPDIFLNVTSHSNCSPWLLRYADSVWMNNAADIYYEGSGSNLDQCLNYRDGRYYDLTLVRQLQFPLAYIYNHEPCYAERNYNPPLPSKSHKTVIYTDAEFEKYLYMCMMRGTGFVELYYSPHMMTEGKLAVNAKVLKWAEANYDIIKSVKYFGGIPKEKCVYGYVGFVDKQGILAVRNSSNKALDYCLDIKQYSNIGGIPNLVSEYGNLDGVQVDDKGLHFSMQPSEVKVIKINY